MAESPHDIDTGDSEPADSRIADYRVALESVKNQYVRRELKDLSRFGNPLKGLKQNGKFLSLARDLNLLRGLPG
jgi:hypothetical protein